MLMLPRCTQPHWWGGGSLAKHIFLKSIPFSGTPLLCICDLWLTGWLGSVWVLQKEALLDHVLQKHAISIPDYCLLGFALVCKRDLQSHVLVSCRWRPAPIVPFNHQVQFFPEHSFCGCNVHYVHSIWTDLFLQYWCCSKCPVPVISQSLHISAVGSLMFKSRLHPPEVYQNLCQEGTWIENIAFRQSKLIASRVHTR